MSARLAATLPGKPDMLAPSPDGTSLYVTLRDADKLLMLSAADFSVRKEAPTGTEPHGLVYRP